MADNRRQSILSWNLLQVLFMKRRFKIDQMLQSIFGEPDLQLISESIVSFAWWNGALGPVSSKDKIDFISLKSIASPQNQLQVPKSIATL